MHETVCHKKIKRPVYDRGLAPQIFGAQALQQFIRPKRAVRFQQYFKDARAHRRQAEIVYRTMPARLVHS